MQQFFECYFDTLYGSTLTVSREMRASDETALSDELDPLWYKSVFTIVVDRLVVSPSFTAENLDVAAFAAFIEIMYPPQLTSSSPPISGTF